MMIFVLGHGTVGVSTGVMNTLRGVGFQNLNKKYELNTRAEEGIQPEMVVSFKDDEAIDGLIEVLKGLKND